MPVSFDIPGTQALPSTLATANLPRRVRRVLDHLLSLVSDEMARHLGNMLNDFEQQLFRLADHARNPGLQAGYMETLRTMRLNRADLVPRFMLSLEQDEKRFDAVQAILDALAKPPPPPVESRKSKAKA